MKLENILDVASMGLSAQRQRLAVIAENLANMNTTRTASGEPYRRRDVVLATVERDPGSFANLLDEELREATKGVRVAGIQESQAPFQRIYKPGHPDADKDGYVLLPNVNLIEELGDLRLAQRSYEAGLQVVSTARSMLLKTLEIGR
ncbi:MAG: flagellar basal body rod protein FlgC [Myxococcales bacterium]|nr:flagellar basal body rod protein FlgC [Myxococcales bacterium]